MGNKGTNYEKKIYSICNERGCIYPGTFNAGGTGGADISLLHNGINLSVECKSNGADYGQKELHFNNGGWSWAKPDKITELYDFLKVRMEIDSNFTPYNANHKNIPQSQWNKEKRLVITEEKKAHDQLRFEKSGIKCPIELLYEYYKLRNCFYIQIDKYGFYHLAEDRFKLGTEKFNGEVHLRLRAKSIHAHEYWMNDRKIPTKGAFMKLQETASISDLFKITPKPWHYGFFAVMKLKNPPSKSRFSLDENELQPFPKIIF